MEIAHRGLWNHQNNINGIVRISNLVGAVEVDVRTNSNGELVLCHDKDEVDEKNNDTLKDLCKVSQKLRIILEIKENIAQKVLETISGSNHEWELCSFDYRCVDDLCRTSGYKVGFITTGAPHPKALRDIDFISQDYEFFDTDMLKMYREHNLDVYIFNTNKNVQNVDGIIKNIFLDISK
tara:strand:- start:215 stop:754 length:540 start_codon:yes stop_codon:yes gene_type:complete